MKKPIILIILITLSLAIALPFFQLKDVHGLSAEDIACAKRDSHLIFENPLERLLILKIVVDKKENTTLFVSAYTIFGLKYATVELVCDEYSTVTWSRWQPRNEMRISSNELTPEQTLVNFFDSLVNEDYEKAIKTFHPLNAHGDYDWNLVTQYSKPDIQNPTKAEELAYYCEVVGTCLEIEVLSGTDLENGVYTFNVQFKNTDGTIFLYGPFGGSPAEQSPPQTTFQYSVKKIDGLYKVITPPLYRP